MKLKETRVTTKYQTTVPKEIREILDIKKGSEIEWQVVRGLVIVSSHKKIKNPTKFLTSQTKLNIDAVRLVREARDEI